MIAIVNERAQTVARYSYDAWGVCTVTQDAGGIATINPFRYRSYYFDQEIGLYYLQSRYYDAGVGRFINADAIAMLSFRNDEPFADNLFTYCCNDPVDYFDELGIFKLSLGAKIAIGIVGIVAAIAITIASGGSALPALLTILKQVLGSMVISMAIQGIIGYIVGGKAGLKQGLLDGAADGFMWGGIGAAISAVSKVISVGKCGKFVSSKCFVAGTLISTPFGHVPIENIKPGDSVYAYDEISKNKVIGIVENVFRSETRKTITLHLEGHTIKSTCEHPYYIIGRGWIEACQINVGDILQNIHGDCVKVEKIEVTDHTHPTSVFNFKVKEYHTYYVSAAEILVHNANCGMKNIRTLEKTKIKNYKVSMDIERGGSGLTNIHAEVDGIKYFWNGTKFLSKNGKEIPKALRDNPTIIKALKKALEKITKGAI